jgi:serine/threonine-protein kinase
LAAVVGAERFLAEIKTTANLQHPHILPLHDSGEADGFRFDVMPYVEGESLREKLDREKQLGVDDALSLAAKLCDALDYAHSEGVIHRDIKPANILLSKRGEPLVADFGIALAVAHAGGGRITETGLSLGTPHYMSPEQASGDAEVDPRSDVYALACVVYELLAGEPPFTASTAQAILAKILTMDAPSVTMVRRTVPGNVSAAVSKALEKLPADRFATISDFGAALADPGFVYRARARGAGVVQSSGTTQATERAAPWIRDARSVATLGVALLASATATWALLRSAPPSQPGVVTRAEVQFLSPGFRGRKFAISPDGRWIVGSHMDDSFAFPGLYVRGSADVEWRRLPNTDFGQSPVFSPDGRSVAFWRGGGIERVPITGGPALPITRGSQAHWTATDEVVYQSGGNIFSVPAAGGEPTVLFESGEVIAQWPHLLPNGRAVVFGTLTGGDPIDGRVMLYDLETRELRELVPSGNQPAYVPTGHLVYGHGDQALMGVPFDLETLQVTGPPVTLLPELEVDPGGVSDFAVSQTGTLIYALPISLEGQDSPLYWLGMDGNEEPLSIQSASVLTPRVSPDGRLIAYTSGEHIWVHDVDAERDRQLTFEGTNRTPVWSPDGRLVYFLSERSGTNGFDGFMKAADGGSDAIQLWTAEGETALSSISPDGRWLVVSEQGATRDIALFELRADSAATITGFLRGPAHEAEAVISPDGQWIAYWLQSDETQGIFVRRFPDGSGLQRVSNEGFNSFDPVWSPDGRSLYFRARGLYRADVSLGSSFSVGEVTLLVDPILAETGGPFTIGYDIHPDGDRLVVVREGSGGIGSVHLVTNWFTELRERMGESN